MNYKKFILNTDQIWQLFLVMCTLVAITTLSDEASASASADGISGTLCKVTNALMGPIGKAVATIAVVVLGIGLFLGKLSWGLAMATAIGIGMIFSASTIVTWLGGTGSNCSAT